MLQDAPYREVPWLHGAGSSRLMAPVGCRGRGVCARAEPLPNGGGAWRGGLNHLDSFLPSMFQFGKQEGEAEVKTTACVSQGVQWLPALVS